MTPENFKELSKKQKILLVAKYIIENKTTIEKTAEHFELSTSCIKKYINDPDNLQKIDMNAYQTVKKIQEELIVIGHYVGGKNGKREPSITDFEAMELAETMLEDKLTLKQASNMFDIPTSTIYERIRNINDPAIQKQLDELFNLNKEYFGAGNINRK